MIDGFGEPGQKWTTQSERPKVDGLELFQRGPRKADGPNGMAQSKWLNVNGPPTHKRWQKVDGLQRSKWTAAS